MTVDIFFIDLTISIVFLFVISLIILEKNRALISLIGAVFIILILTLWQSSIPSDVHINFEEFVSSNLQIIVIIVGLMILVEIFIDSGVFEFMAIKIIKFSKGSPKKLFLYFTLLTYGLSIIIANVGAILIIVPLTITTCRILKIEKALPYFIISEQLSTVCSGLVLPISSIPNLIISTQLNFTFFDFILFSAPFSLLILITIIFLIRKVFLSKGNRLKEPPEKLKIYLCDFDENCIITRKNFFKISLISLILLIVSIVIFQAFAHIVIIIYVIFLLAFSKLEIDKIIKKIDWNTIFFLIGLL